MELVGGLKGKYGCNGTGGDGGDDDGGVCVCVWWNGVCMDCNDVIKC